MVRGLATFKNHFAEYRDQYVLIGGAASAELMEQSGLPFRGTRDLDVVLIVEAMTNEFVQAFWDFIENGRYDVRSHSQSERKYYRFENPEDEIYPECLELFSRIPDNIRFEGHGRFTPIPLEDDLSSLSAILLDDNYYPLILNGRDDLDGLSCLKVEYIIILKAKAWLDLHQRKADSRKVNRQKNDVIRLFPLLNPSMRIDIPEAIQDDLKEYLKAIAEDKTINLKDLGISQFGITEIVKSMEQIYGLSN
ncbi:MAG TPA: hypothetical protein DHW79_00900 [Candidatus Cloacimonas sp.]|jgi:hypothetical protein|nr:hypothetical protein [Candidatus Cloacimonas sp.]